MRDKEIEVLEILRKSLELYDVLEGLVREQERKIEESDIEGLLKIISKKQNVISEQDRLNEALERIQTGLSNVIEQSQGDFRLLDLLSDSVKEEVRKILDSIKAKISKILEAENRSREKLSLEVEKVKEALKSLREGKKAIAEYYSPSRVQEPRFIDQRK